MAKSIIVVPNGDLATADSLKNAVNRGAESVIGVDGGTHHLLAVGIIPDIVIGDLDSVSAEHIKTLEDNWVNIFNFTSEKDETDLELALLYVVAQPDWSDLPIDIHGALGGRIDHELANLMLLSHPKLAGRTIRLHAPHQTTFLISESAQIHGRAGDLVSLIPLNGDAHIASTENLKWPLNDSVLKFGPARGISNVMTASTCSVSLKSGSVLCIHTDGSWKR